MLVEGSEQFAISLAERLLEQLSLPATVGDRTLAFGASIGIVDRTRPTAARDARS